MLILAIETSTLACSVVLSENETILAEINMLNVKNHSQNLMRNIEKLFSLTSIKKNDLTCIAVSSGPGSFTGLRIGVTTAKILSYALQTELVLVPTLQVIAFATIAPKSFIVPVMDAQKNNIYTATYFWQENDLINKEKMQISSIDDFNKKIELLANKDTVVISGETKALLSKNKAEINYGKNITIIENANRLPLARNVALLSLKMLKDKKKENCFTAKPMYMRASAAEEAVGLSLKV